MITFFRKIRQRLLTENKLTRYLIYAIGEITLVMIGILLALQVNNWNEGRKQQAALEAIYRITQEDLRNDIVEIEAFVKNYEETRKPVFEDVLHGELTPKDWMSNQHYRNVLGGFKDFNLNLRGFELLKARPNQSANMGQNLVSKINLFYNKHIVEIEVGLQEMAGVFSNNMMEMGQFDWFSDYVLEVDQEGFIDYVLYNPKAKNNVALYSVVYGIYAKELTNFKTNGEALILEIDEHFD